MSARGLAVIGAALAALQGRAGADALAELELAQQALYARVASSVVYLANGKSIGSGFFVQPGLILTSRHVIEGAATLDVTLSDGRKLAGTVVERAGGEIDLALIRVPATNVAPLELSLQSPKVGAWIASVGHGVDSPWTFTTGMVSNVYMNRQGWPALQTQIPLNPGSSGGPIVDRHGKVVGIVAKGITSANSVNFAIGAQVATRELRSLSSLAPRLVILAPPGTPVFVDGQLAGAGPEVATEPGAHKVSAVVRGKLVERTTAPADRALDLR